MGAIPSSPEWQCKNGKILLSFVNSHDFAKHCLGIGVGALEGVAAYDGTVAAAVIDVAGVLINGVFALGCAAGEYDEAAAIEAGTNDFANAVFLRLKFYRVLFVIKGFFSFWVVDFIVRQFDLYDMSAEQAGDVRGIGDDIDRRFIVFIRNAIATGIGPDDGSDACVLGFADHLAAFFKHIELVVGTRINGEANGGAAKLKRIFNRGGNGLIAISIF